MTGFTYYTPTKVLFGRGVEGQAAKEIRAFGGSKVLLHYGGQSAVKSGLIPAIRQQLTDAGLPFVELGGVKPNPRLSLVREGIALCRKEKVDFILAVGGGSVIDSAKAISVGFYMDTDVWDYYENQFQPVKTLPVGTVLTISAAGSEMSSSSVINNDDFTDGDLKKGHSDDLTRPKFALMNPELTFTLPKYQIACGVVDILMHTIERYFTNEKDLTVTDELAEGLMRAVIKEGRVAVENPTNYTAMANIMWAGSLSHNGLTGCGGVQDFASHQIEMELSGMYDVAHGAGLAVIFPAWATYVMDHDVGRFVQFAVNVWGVNPDGKTEKQTAVEGIERCKTYFRSIGMPINLAELGIPNLDRLEELAVKCTFFGKRTIGNFVKLGKEEIMDIYRIAAEQK